MADYTDAEYRALLGNIQRDTACQSKRILMADCDSDFVGIHEFMGIIHNVFKIGKYLYELPEEQKEPDSYVRKFILTEEYPDFSADMNNRQIVTMELQKRQLASLGKDSRPFSGTVNYKPMYLGEQKDIVSNEIVMYMQNMYDNEIKMTCWAPKLRTANMLALLIESVMTKHFWALRKHSSVFVYTGRKNTEFNDSHRDSRYFGVPMCYFVRTNERFTVNETELRSVGISSTVESSLIKQECK